MYNLFRTKKGISLTRSLTIFSKAIKFPNGKFYDDFSFFTRANTVFYVFVFYIHMFDYYKCLNTLLVKLIDHVIMPCWIHITIIEDLFVDSSYSWCLSFYHVYNCASSLIDPRGPTYFVCLQVLSMVLGY